MTLDHAGRVYKVMDKMPEALRTIYKTTLEKTTEQSKLKLNKLHNEITTKESLKEFPEFYGHIICALSNITKKSMKYVLNRQEIYQMTMEGGESCESVVMGLMQFPVGYKIESIKAFEWEGETLLLPEYKEQLGKKIPMANEQVITFAEATDLQIHADALEMGKYKAMQNIISILCRPKGEEE